MNENERKKKYKIFYQNIGKKKIRENSLPTGFGKKKNINKSLKKLCKSLGKY